MAAVSAAPRQRQGGRIRGRIRAPELLTLGIVYAKLSRFAAALQRVSQKVDRFSERTLQAAYASARAMQRVS